MKYEKDNRKKTFKVSEETVAKSRPERFEVHKNGGRLKLIFKPSFKMFQINLKEWKDRVKAYFYYHVQSPHLR